MLDPTYHKNKKKPSLQNLSKSLIHQPHNPKHTGRNSTQCAQWKKVLILFFLFPRFHVASAAWQTLHWTQYKGSQVPLICIRIGRLEGKRNDFQGLVLKRRKSHVCLVYIVSKVPELHSRGKIKQWQECTFVSHLYLSVLQETSNITCLFG